MSDHTPDDQAPAKAQIDWVKTAAGALAAMSSAVLLSTLGAAGTLVGAALGSVAVTISTALYSQGIATSKRTVAVVQNTALTKVGLAQTEVRRAARSDDEDVADAHLEHAEEKLEEARAELEGEPDEGADPDATPAPPSWKDRLAGLPWKRIALLAAGLFLVAMIVISAFELISGRSVSSYTGGSDSGGGTSITDMVGGGGDKDDEPDPERDGDPDAPGTQQPTPGQGESSEADPTEEPSETATEESEEPTESPSTSTPPTSSSPTAGATP